MCKKYFNVHRCGCPLYGYQGPTYAQCSRFLANGNTPCYSTDYDIIKHNVRCAKCDMRHRQMVTYYHDLLETQRRKEMEKEKEGQNRDIKGGGEGEEETTDEVDEVIEGNGENPGVTGGA